MKYSDNDMSAILLTSRIGLGNESGLKPFTPKEWGNFLQVMQDAGMEPGEILSHDFRGDEFFLLPRECGNV